MEAMGAIPTDPIKAATVQAHWEVGYSASEAARIVGVPDRTARQWVNNEGLQTRLAETRRGIKDRLQAESLDIAGECLGQVRKTLDKASAYQAAGIYGLLRQHERIDAGEPTSIVASVNVEVEGRIDEVVQALGSALLLKSQASTQEIDVTPAKSDVTPGKR